MSSSSPAPDSSGRNRLGEATSPYLRQHKDNPVHWWTWNDAALATARALNRPILLSVGYSACHWCHVMAHESFEDPQVAGVMNRLFVNIKVDREERPDLDAIYQKALALLGEQGGWPLTMFLMPDGRPFWGGTYFPPQSAYGRPGFAEVLAHIDRIWRERPEDAAEQGAALTAAVGEVANERLRDGVSVVLFDTAAERLLDYVDEAHGGLRGAPKFPMPFLWEFVWGAARRIGSTALHDTVIRVLEEICQGGIYDHVGGGFARYSTDAEWLVPHFEKMLYDNAQLISLLTLVWKEAHQPLFATRIAETIAWAEREMIAQNGAFAAALDADSGGEEGAFYVWTEVEIDLLLGADAPAFKAAYNVTPNGNWEGHAILNRTGQRFEPAEEEQLASCRDVLLEARANRERPGRDDKALADWNGLMIAALAQAGMAMDRPEWVDLARRVFSAVQRTMSWSDTDGRARLGHVWCAGELQRTAMLDDYANMAAASLVLHGATGEPAYLEYAESWVGTVNALYWDDDAGGYFFTAADGDALIARPKTAADAATPSGNGVMIDVLARLFHITGKADYRNRARASVETLSPEVLRSFPHGVKVATSFALLEQAVQVVIVGHPAAPSVKAMSRVAHLAPEPDIIVTVVPDPGALAPSHPAYGKAALGAATAYICRGPVCETPVTSAADLATRLDARC